MNIKKIVSRKTGNELTVEEASNLCKKLKVEMNMIYVEYKSVSGYPTPELSERANLHAVVEEHKGYTFAYLGTVKDGFEGYKVLAIAVKDLNTSTFEKHYPNYVVIG